MYARPSRLRVLFQVLFVLFALFGCGQLLVTTLPRLFSPSADQIQSSAETEPTALPMIRSDDETANTIEANAETGDPVDTSDDDVQVHEPATDLLNSNEAAEEEWQPVPYTVSDDTTTPSQPVTQTYTVRRGDTLATIAARFGVTLQNLMAWNGIKKANLVQVGQVLKITAAPPRATVTHLGPADRLVPDSEVVYGPAYKDFDVNAFANQYNGYLVNYRELVEGKVRTGPEIIQLVAERFSVGPRILLAILELKSGWVTQRNPTKLQLAYPMGYMKLPYAGLFNQASWVAVRLNAAYYARMRHQLITLSLFDGDRVELPVDLNPGSAAVQNVIARSSSWDTFTEQVTNYAFLETYLKFFGNPYDYEIKSVIPAKTIAPALALPWSDGDTWWFTGGPHNGWAEGSPWAAVDFAPDSTRGTCKVSPEWALAVAPGKIVQAENGRIIEDLDGDGYQGTGWALMYMHISSSARVAIGTQVQVGDRIGHPSCEGGYSTGTHMHFARLYNGMWIPADDPRFPLALGDWVIQGGENQYDGFAFSGDQVREACGCKNPEQNAMLLNVEPLIAKQRELERQIAAAKQKAAAAAKQNAAPKQNAAIQSKPSVLNAANSNAANQPTTLNAKPPSSANGATTSNQSSR
ncbi:MAG TPA: LysM peptidoglycan-binding domain-containing protein [Anaerolineae bacterium]|nr:LysM peptidoglycan-binding domain-containing protein [Anaerolineae bacterium]